MNSQAREVRLSTLFEQPSASGAAAGEFVVVCLCADWCGVCRDYAAGFSSLATRFPAVGFYWLDIEAHADDLGDLEVENFPTLLIRRRQHILFFGAMPPAPVHLKRMLEAFLQQSEEESRNYAGSGVERRAWQEDCDLQRLGRDPRGRIRSQAAGGSVAPIVEPPGLPASQSLPNKQKV